MSKQLWCIIPARSGSVGVQDKNVRPLPDGTTLLGRAVTMAGALTEEDCIVVSTDYSAERLNLRKLAGVKIIAQPRVCSSGRGSMMALMIHALLCVDAEPEDSVLLLQPTSPFRTLKTGLSVIEALHSVSGYDSVCSVMPFPITWHPAYAIGPGDVPKWPTRRQDLAPAYRPDGSYYASTVGQLLTGSWGRMGTVIAPPESSLTIDTEDDWKKAEARVLLE